MLADSAGILSDSVGMLANSVGILAESVFSCSNAMLDTAEYILTSITVPSEVAETVD